MNRITSSTISLFAALAPAGIATAQQVLITPDDSLDRLVAFSPIDGSLINANVFPIATSAQVTALQVGSEFWVGEQINDKITRYDVCGNVLGVIGPTFVGGGLDNIRGMSLIGGTVYVTNDGSNNGATADSLVKFDMAGNHVGTIALSTSPSPFTVLPYGSDLLVVSSSGPDRVHRYTTAGVSLGTFNDSASLGFSHAAAYASDGNIWLSTFTTDTIVKLDVNTGAILQTIPADNARGIYELANGNLLWTTANGGTFVYDFATSTNTQIHDGGTYNLRLADLGCAFHSEIGAGCHSFEQDNTNLLELFPDVATADTALTGNAMSFTLTANGYVANWLPGGAAALYVAPSGSATIVANASTTTATFTPSAAIPVPGGTTATWTISSEGILTAGSTGNQGTSSTVTLSSTQTATGLAWYTWVNQNPAETGSGKFKWEEVAGVLYVTAEGVELGTGTPTLSPSTYQWQINMATGDVTMVWVSMFGVANTSTSDVLVGCTLAGAGYLPVSQTLSTVSNKVLGPDAALVPMSLSASPAPVINPSTLVTYTISNIPETAPGSGLHLSTMFFSVAPLPGGIDITGLVTTVPGCKLYIGSLDVNLGTAITLSPTSNVQLTFSTPLFLPGNAIGAQAVGFFDAAFPLVNGENSGLLLSNGVLSVTRTQ